ncbi:MAG TPA: septum formation initiator family protein [Candidatus Binataceae bacterium]|nr:septum formation initiator family protein [Candidatus Binataceae bacterium]
MNPDLRLIYDSHMARLSSLLRRNWPSLIPAVLLAGLIGSGLRPSQGPRLLLSLSQRRARLTAENNALREQNAHLERQVARLRSDDAYLQRLIRDEFGYARADEFVYHFHAAAPVPH